VSALAADRGAASRETRNGAVSRAQQPFLGVDGMAALGAVLLWSTNALAANLALGALTVYQLLSVQFVAATVALAAFRAHRSRGAGSRAALRLRDLPVAIVGLTGTIFLQYLAFASAPIVEANILAYAWPLFVAVWAAVAHRGRHTLIGVLLAVIGFAGVVLIFAGGGAVAAGGGQTAGYLAALGSAGCMAFYTATVSRTRTSAHDLLLAATTAGAVVAFVLAQAQGAPWPGAAAWPAAVYIGLGPMAAGFLLWTTAMSGSHDGRCATVTTGIVRIASACSGDHISGTGSRRLAPLGYATPLLSTGLLVAAGEAFTRDTLLGATLVAVCTLGVLVADYLRRRRP
jgi:drug/metabolite transporter (DMT)-like permease